MREVDFIIIGGGSAGCVIANRLSASAANDVVLLEAGGAQPALFGDMPAAFFNLMGSKHDWNYMSEPESRLDGRTIPTTGGKMLGGGSSINGLIYIRGIRSDYDGWADAGCTGWSFDEIFPYFQRSERYTGNPTQSHGTDGPLTVSPPRTLHPIARAFVRACSESGIPETGDYCAGDQFGAFLSLTTMKNGRRASTARAFLDPVRNRPNLTIETGAHVDKLIIENGRAVGVVYRRNGERVEVRAHKEVIVAAGAIASPAILLRSGIGPQENLASVGIEPTHLLKGVGQNLQEHPCIGIAKQVNVPTYNTQLGLLSLSKSLAQYLAARRGMLTTSANQAMACYKSRPDLHDPDIQISFVPLAIDFNSSTPALAKVPGIYIAANPLRPESRGEITLRSPDLNALPVINYRLLSEQRDLDLLLESCRIIENLYNEPSLAPFIVGPISPAASPDDDDQWTEWILNTVGIGYHAAGTCKMGVGEDAVVDPRLRVVGMKGLRVIDASIMPTLISGNTNAPTIMIAEKGAEMILDDWRGNDHQPSRGT